MLTQFAEVGVQENLGLAVSPSGVVYVSDLFGSSIWEVRGQNDSVLFASDVGLGPWGLAFDKSGDLYAADAWGDRIEKFSDISGSPVKSTFAHLTDPLSLAFGQGGRLFVGQEDSITVITPEGDQRVFAMGFSSVRGLAFFNYVPEPGTLALLGLGLAGLAFTRRRKQ